MFNHYPFVSIGRYIRRARDQPVRPISFKIPKIQDPGSKVVTQIREGLCDICRASYFLRLSPGFLNLSGKGGPVLPILHYFTFNFFPCIYTKDITKVIKLWSTENLLFFLECPYSDLFSKLVVSIFKPRADPDLIFGRETTSRPWYTI